MRFILNRKSTFITLVRFLAILVTVSFESKDTIASSPEPQNPTNSQYVYLPLVSRRFEPLYVGFNARWDGVGYLRLDYFETVGYHVTRFLDAKIDNDVGRILNTDWYDPDPYGWGSSQWYTYYSLSGGDFLSSSVPGDPTWKWGWPWIVPYGFQFYHGQIAYVNGQKFSVTGPHSGFTAFGKPVDYWKLVNTERFVMWDGGDWLQYVHIGDAELRYDAGRTRLLVYDDVKRTLYYQGGSTPYNVEYVDTLSSSNSWPAAVYFEPPGSQMEEAEAVGNKGLNPSFDFSSHYQAPVESLMYPPGG